MSGQSWVYVKSEPACFTVGFYDPQGKWQSDSDHRTPEAATARVNYLNGGAVQSDLAFCLRQCLNEIDAEIEQRKTSGMDEYWESLQKVSDASHVALRCARAS